LYDGRRDLALDADNGDKTNSTTGLSRDTQAL
jgi:hypothetical protein